MLHKKPVTYNGLVSVIFIADGEIDFLVNIFRNITEQTYKNVEYIFVHPPTFNIELFYEKIRQKTDVDLSTRMISVQTDMSHQMIDKGIEQAEGEIIFIKNCQPVIWYPNHIVSHIRAHQQKKMRKSFLLSNIEIKAIEESPDNPFTTLNYRVGKKIEPKDILIDEISFTKDVALSFGSYIDYIDQQGTVHLEMKDGLIEQFNQTKLVNAVSKLTGSIQFSDEISVIMLVNSRSNEIISRLDWPSDQTLQVLDDDLEAVHHIPTIFGNNQLKQWNDKMLQHLKENWDHIQTRAEQKIIIKRTIGMGDVIQTSGLVSYLKKTFPLAEIWFVTSKSRGCAEIVNTFTAKPDKVILIDELQLLNDTLGYTNLPKLLEENGYDKNTMFDFRLDLDLAYESRPGMRFVDAYYDTIQVKAGEPFYQPRPQLDIENYLSNLGEYRQKQLSDKTLGLIHLGKDVIACCLGGSGWGGKELNVVDAENICRYLTEKDYVLVHVSPFDQKYEHLVKYFSLVNSENDFDLMLLMMRGSIGYIGADNGPMHIAQALELPICVWNGAALSFITTCLDNNTPELTVIHKDLSCLGCKHKIFYSLVQEPENKQVHINFLPECNNAVLYECMTKFDDNLIISRLDTFMQNLEAKKNSTEPLIEILPDQKSE